MVSILTDAGLGLNDEFEKQRSTLGARCGGAGDRFGTCPDHESHITQCHGAQLPLTASFLKHSQHAQENIIPCNEKCGHRGIYEEFGLIKDRAQALNVSFTLSLEDVAKSV